jgi:hypothetical protein
MVRAGIRGVTVREHHRPALRVPVTTTWFLARTSTAPILASPARTVRAQAGGFTCRCLYSAAPGRPALVCEAVFSMYVRVRLAPSSAGTLRQHHQFDHVVLLPLVE